MFLSLVTMIDRLRRDQDGVTLVEYGVAVAFAVLAGGVMVGALFDNFSAAMDAAGAVMNP